MPPSRKKRPNRPEKENLMRRAVIVSTARTPIGRAYRGAFNDTQPQALAGHAIAEAVRRAGVEPGEIDDVIIGAALQQGGQGSNVARQSAMRAGLPDTVAAMSLDRQCSSGMMAIATAAKEIMHDGMTIAVGGGVESVSLVQNEHMNRFRAQDPALVERIPALYMTMLETAEIVADRYGVSREAQDEYSLRSQQRTAAAQQAGRFDDEIAPLSSVMLVADRNTGETSKKSVTLDKDEGNRPDTNLEGLAGLKPVFTDGQRGLNGPCRWQGGRAHGRARADRGQTTRREMRRLHDVRRRRHGCGRAVRGRLRADLSSVHASAGSKRR